MNTQYDASFWCADCGQLKQACTCQPVVQTEPARYARLMHPSGATQRASVGGELYNDLIRRGWIEKAVTGDE